MAGPRCDILVTGAGRLAERTAFDIALLAAKPVRVVLGARRSERDRLRWLVMTASARAAVAGRPARFAATEIDWRAPRSIARAIEAANPRILVQAASVQTPAVVHDRDTPWGLLVRKAGLSVTAVFSALLSSRVGKALALAGTDTVFVNTAYPDVVNGILAAQGIDVAFGTGNVEILAACFAGREGIHERGRVKVLAHHQNLMPFRGPPGRRGGVPPRVWIDGVEVEDVYERYRSIRLTRESAIDISGFCGVPLYLATLGHFDVSAHAPGVRGRPGGYPVKVRRRKLSLDLPPGVSEAEAVAWNLAFEVRCGMVVEPGGRAVYTGRLRDLLARHSRELAGGFHVDDLETVYPEMERLRRRLRGRAEREAGELRRA